MSRDKDELPPGRLVASGQPCPKCGGSDPLAIYEKEGEDGEVYYDGHCWSNCGHLRPEELEDWNSGYEPPKRSYDYEELTNKMSETELTRIADLGTGGSKKRGLMKKYMEMYGIKIEFDQETGAVKAHYYPETKANGVTGYHKRLLPKKYSAVGDVKGCQLFGQWLYETGKIQHSKKYLIITEGHLDCVAVQQVMSENGDKRFHTPVVSITSGAGSAVKEIERNFKFVNSFENIIIMFDNDKPGREASEDVAKKLPVGKAKISKLPAKDPCELTKNRRDQELYSAFFKAELYSPAGVVGSASTWEALVERAKWEKVPLPAFAMQLQEQLNGGPALGEITTIAAASSVGKTSITNEFLYHFVMSCSYKVGIISLESDKGELMENLLSIHIGIKLANMDDEEKLAFYESDRAKKAFKELTTLPDGTDRFMIVDHQGDVVDDKLKEQMEFLVKGCNCKITALDPLTLALSGEGNEGVDKFMSWLLRFVKAEMISHINVVHVRKNGNGATANSRGAEISEEMIKGSGSQFQVSMNNILLMRDKVHEDPRIRNTTRVVLSKARRTGKTGPAGFWYYNGETSRLEVGQDPEDIGGYHDDEQLFEEAGAFNNTVPEEFDEILAESQSEFE